MNEIEIGQVWTSHDGSHSVEIIDVDGSEVFVTDGDEDDAYWKDICDLMDDYSLDKPEGVDYPAATSFDQAESAFLNAAGTPSTPAVSSFADAEDMFKRAAPEVSELPSWLAPDGGADYDIDKAEKLYNQHFPAPSPLVKVNNPKVPSISLAELIVMGII